jgi:DNA polymerase IV
MATQTIMHVDMDAFFVACEVRRDPSLAGKAVIVGGNPDGRGVVCSASYEARRFGVRSTMPSSRARRLCPEALFLRGQMEDYVETSRRLRALFEEVTPVVEMASLDEAHLDLTGTERLWGPPRTIAERLRDRIQEAESLPASFGVGTTKTIAKIASDWKKPRGLVIVEPGQEAEFLAPMPLRRLPGIGPKTHERLAGWGLKVIGDLADLGPERLAQVFGEAGRDLWARAVGQDTGRVTPSRERKSVGRETTFDTDVDDMETALATLSRLAEDVASRLRVKGFSAQHLTLKLRHSDFQTLTRATTFPTPTNLETDLIDAARDLLRRHWTRRVRLRLLGLSCSGLVEDVPQLDLLEGPSRERQAHLASAIDAIRKRHGAEAIRRGSSAPPRGDTALPPWETGGQEADPH